MKTVAGIPRTLVGLLVSVGVLRASGFLDFLGELLQMPAALLHIPPQIVPVVPGVWYPTQPPQGWCWIYLRSTAQTPSLGLIASCTHEQYGRQCCTCLSVYFGSVGITRTRHTLAGAHCHGGGVAASVVLAGRGQISCVRRLPA